MAKEIEKPPGHHFNLIERGVVAYDHFVEGKAWPGYLPVININGQPANVVIYFAITLNCFYLGVGGHTI